MGKTASAAGGTGYEGKHPHERGEDTALRASLEKDLETPPRAWGRLPVETLRQRNDGNTPTSVGKTLNSLLHLIRRKKHPHERGEDPVMWSIFAIWAETPPRAWGRPDFINAVPTTRRNTPTSVGKTLKGIPFPCGQWKHPHERGEDNIRTQIQTITQETPPRAWGRRADILTPACIQGNTPTSVGKTALLKVCPRGLEKHPHERGEDSTSRRMGLRIIETPPRAWGRHAYTLSVRESKGNTPTSVGKTVAVQSSIVKIRKHPHERGEDSVILLDFITQKIGSILVANELQAIQ